jgi:hypothetical protein
MAIVISAECYNCGDSFTACGPDSAPPPAGGTCSTCLDARKLRDQYGKGEDADRLIAFLLGPARLEALLDHEAKQATHEHLSREYIIAMGDALGDPSQW